MSSCTSIAANSSLWYPGEFISLWPDSFLTVVRQYTIPEVEQNRLLSSQCAIVLKWIRRLLMLLLIHTIAMPLLVWARLAETPIIQHNSSLTPSQVRHTPLKRWCSRYLLQDGVLQFKNKIWSKLYNSVHLKYSDDTFKWVNRYIKDKGFVVDTNGLIAE